MIDIMFTQQSRIQYIGRETENLKYLSVYIVEENKKGALKLEDMEWLYLPYDITKPIQDRPPYTYKRNFVYRYTKEEIDMYRKKLEEEAKKNIEKHLINKNKRQLLKDIKTKDIERIRQQR